MKNKQLPAVLRWNGALGHRFIVIERSDHWTATDGYCTKIHCNEIDAWLLKDMSDGQRVFENLGGKPRRWKEVKLTVAQRLVIHLEGDGKDGTMNDSTTDALYREALRVAPDAETSLEDVEAWAQKTAAKARKAVAA